MRLAVSNGTIEGRIGLFAKDGVIPCGGARVYLLLRPLDVDSVKRKVIEKHGHYIPHLAHMHFAIVMTSPETQHRLSYARTKTREDGSFVFKDLPPDRWYYVTAQALTEQVMVSWQMGVYLREGERVQVILTNTNAALPMYHTAGLQLERQAR